MIRPYHASTLSPAVEIGIKNLIEPLANCFDLTLKMWEIRTIFGQNETVLTLYFKRKSFDDGLEHSYNLPITEKNAFEPVELPKDFAQQLKNIYFGNYLENQI